MKRRTLIRHLVLGLVVLAVGGCPGPMHTGPRPIPPAEPAGSRASDREESGGVQAPGPAPQRTECRASGPGICGECSISCDVGERPVCVPGKMVATRCAQEPFCGCRR